jgi:hypothetical protein
MIPNVFVSSTVDDLRHLREGVRDVIAEIGYNPVLSEYGEIGYLPTTSAEESCYIAVRQCQLQVLVIAKRYGQPRPDGLSVTHHEFRAARQASIPVIALIDKDVMSFKAVFDANKRAKKSPVFPGMDHPDKTFSLIDEIAAYEVNNGFQAFSNVADVRAHVRRQLAHFVGDLLQSTTTAAAPDLKDILAELKTLRYEFGSSRTESALPFLRAMRALLSGKNQQLAELLKMTHEELELAAPQILSNETLHSFLENSGWQYTVVPDLKPGDDELRDWFKKARARAVGFFLDDENLEGPPGFYVVERDNHVRVNDVAARIYERQYGVVRAAAATRSSSL